MLAVTSATYSGLIDSVFPLFGYERRFVLDPARLKIWLKARQIGGSTTAGLDVALDMVESGDEWNVMSRTGRQAEKVLAKIAKHIRAIDLWARSVLRRPPIIDSITAHQVKLTNGAIATALPCDADTTTGDTCNWLLDEFALFTNATEVFGAIKPSIRWGKRMIVLSTPRSLRHKFAELWKRFENLGRASGWSGHKTTIMDAVADGCPLVDHDGNPITFDEFRTQEIADIGEDLWPREYMCLFTDKGIVFLPMTLIQSCYSERAAMVETPARLARDAGELFVGMDIGRRKDLTVIWVLSRSGDTFTTRSVIELDRTPFEIQRARLGEILALKNVSKCLIDQQGIGMDLAEWAADKFPGKAEGMTFTSATKDAMASSIKTHMQSSRLWIPESADVAEDFNSVEKTFTSSGNPVICAPSSAAGHADRFWAAALALRAGTTYEHYEVAIGVAGGSPRRSAVGVTEGPPAKEQIEALDFADI